jgi:thiamine kinase-like enzyme
VSRRVKLVLVSDRQVLGALPELEVESPWWPDVEPVVRLARQSYGVDISVLRLLWAEDDAAGMGGAVTYSAELLGPLPQPLPLAEHGDDSVLDEHPLRMPWARVGGVASIVAWADAVIADIGAARSSSARQVKTWNLSCVLRLPTDAGDVWCKSVPPFFAHEGKVMQLVGAEDPALVPRVLGVDAASVSVLLAHVQGEDQWDAPEARLIAMVRRWVKAQVTWVDRVDELLSVGLPDWRSHEFATATARLAARTEIRATLSKADLAVLDGLVESLPRRLQDISECGLPDTLVHGDFHPGNWMSDGTSLVLLDWGDSGVGPPMLDAAAFLARCAPDVRVRVRDAWISAWLDALPGSDPARAADLIAPVAALRQALIYQQFLDGIEPSEHIYHAQDVPRWLRQAVTA